MTTLNLKSKFSSTRGGGPTQPAYLAGHVLTEAIREGQPGTWPDKIELECTADYQRQSALMRLPIEVRRRIYELMFEEAGLAQHVYVKDGRYTHTTCITDHEGAR